MWLIEVVPRGMTILVDARPLVDPGSGGVRRLVGGFIRAALQAFPEHHFILVTTGMQERELPFVLPTNAERRHFKMPNKLLNLGIVLGLTSLDRLFPRLKADRLLVTNVGFVGKPRLPYALLVHDVSFLIEPRWFTLKARAWHAFVDAKGLLLRADALLAVSERTVKDVKRLLDRSASLIPVGLDPLPIPPQPFPVRDSRFKIQDSRFVLTMGGGDPRKNTACAEIAARECGVKLIALGRGFRPSDQELSRLMQDAACFLYPSWYEGFGLPLHEAARFGTPCIASTSGALPETAPDGTLFVQPEKPRAWTKMLAEALRAPERYRTKSDIKPWSELSAELRPAVGPWFGV